MTLKDLKTGMIVKTRDGKYHIVMKNFHDEGDILAGISANDAYISNSWSRMSLYNKDMTFFNSEVHDLDIVEVWKASPYCIDVPEKLLWKREEYKVVTMKEIEEKFGCKVKIVQEENK